MSSPAFGKIFKIGLTGLSETFDAHRFDSAGEHIVLEHLVLSLVSYVDDGYLRGVAAKKWDISADHKTYTFSLRDDLKFSNGEKIDAQMVKNSWERPLRYPESLHFDFKNIQSLMVTDPHTLVVKLHEADYFFLYKLLHPEFGILHPSDYEVALNKQTFKITSGHYFIKDRKGDVLILERNKNLKDTELERDLISFENESSADIETLLDGKYDLVWNPQSLVQIDQEKVSKLGYDIKIPRLNFSFWLSINPNLDETKSHDFRSYLQKILMSEQLVEADGPVISPADQLYFDNGPGRLTRAEVSAFKESLSHKKHDVSKTIKLKMLNSQNFKLKDKIVSLLKAHNIEVEVHNYKNFGEYRKLTGENSYHLLQVNNDFCLPDVSTAIEVSFNENRPMIFTTKEHQKILDEVKKLTSVKSMEERNQIAHYVGSAVLKEALVVPLFYYNSVLFNKKSYDLQSWSEVYPDVSTWKIKAIDN